MSRFLILAYGVASYLLFLASFLYTIGFLGNLLVPKSVDSGPASPVAVGVLVDVLLVLLFAVPHSVMARPGFKRWWTSFVPPAVERSTYVLTSSLALALLFWQWRPIPGYAWNVSAPVASWLLQAVFWAGWAIVLASTFLIDHFDLFGLRQVWLYALRRPYTPVGFKVIGLYRYVRHPIMLGFLLAFWATPAMSMGHLLFALGTTAYILIGVQLEERDLVRHHGESYRHYQRQARMIVPIAKLKTRVD
jgi:protein-S-isoprenylcysteine O-methyltransferase Ste14